MKYLITLFFSLLSCIDNAHAQIDDMHNERNYATELIEYGFLKYADSSDFERLKTQLIDSFNIYDDGNFKIAHVDAEELAEFSFDFFLPTLNKMLAKRREFKLSAQKLSDNDHSFDALINGDTIQLYTQSDLINNSIWNEAPRHFFKKVNQLLKSKDCDEQFYLLYGGNDLHTLLLTDREFLVICDYYKDNDKERPYKP